MRRCIVSYISRPKPGFSRMNLESSRGAVTASKATRAGRVLVEIVEVVHRLVDVDPAGLIQEVIEDQLAPRHS
jgi:hypothetical protein